MSTLILLLAKADLTSAYMVRRWHQQFACDVWHYISVLWLITELEVITEAQCMQACHHQHQHQHATATSTRTDSPVRQLHSTRTILSAPGVAVTCVSNQRSYSMPGPVSTWMGDYLKASKPSPYVTSHPGRLSLLLYMEW